jgi:hypothetical protein
METIITSVVIFLIVFLFIGYGVLAVFFPEWVGIAGKKAREIEDKHAEQNNDGPEEIQDL